MDTKPLLRAIETRAKQSDPIVINHIDLTNVKLTHKQQTYAECRAKGATQVASYKQAYDCERMSIGATYTAATELEQNPKITVRIQEIVELENKDKSHDPERIRKLLTDYLEGVVTDTQAKHSDRNKAAELLGKVTGVGLFQAQAIVKPDELADTKQAVTDLQRKLELLLKPKLAS